MARRDRLIYTNSNLEMVKDSDVKKAKLALPKLINLRIVAPKSGTKDTLLIDLITQTPKPAEKVSVK